MVRINSIDISPPLINSSCAWSSDLKQLQELYDSPHTGAVTTRTATNDGFEEDESHTVCVRAFKKHRIFYLVCYAKQVAFACSTLTSINSYGYSPHSLDTYLSWIGSILSSQRSRTKPFIISITSSDPTTLRSMVYAIQRFRAKLNDATSAHSKVAIELNTSCPNIPNSPPSAYKFASLVPLLRILKDEYITDDTLTIGLKLPPFISRDQFRDVLEGIKALCTITDGVLDKCPFAFFTCTNTLGTNLLFAEQVDLADQSSGLFAVPPALGGLAGDSLHTLSLGNVYTFAQLLNESEYAGLQDIAIIGVGGVTSKEAAGRMRRAGAAVVGCATLFGKKGVEAFEIITG